MEEDIRMGWCLHPPFFFLNFAPSYNRSAHISVAHVCVCVVHLPGCGSWRPEGDIWNVFHGHPLPCIFETGSRTEPGAIARCNHHIWA